MRKEKFYLIRLPILLIAMLLCMCSCGKKEEKLVLNEVAHSIFYAPLYVAIEEGYFEEEGIDLELVTGFGADKTMAAVLSDNADIGFMGCETTIYTYDEDNDDYCVNFALLTKRAGNFLVAREKIDDFKWDMLKNKTVLGGRMGGMPEMVFEYILEKNNIDPEKDLTIDKSIDFGSTAAAFAGGQGDFTIEFEPYATSLEENGQGYVVASLGEASGFVPYTAFCAKKSYIDANKEKIEGFVRALKKAMNYCVKNDAETIAKAIAPQFKETDIDALTLMVNRYLQNDSWKEDLVFEEDAFNLLQNILLDGKVIEEKAPYEKLVDTNYVK